MIQILIFIVLALLFVVSPLSASAQYPEKPIHLIVPVPAGGPGDNAARIVAGSLTKALGQPVIVENKPGASGAIGAEAVLRSRPDGYTLLWGSNSVLVGVPLLRKRPPFDPVADFTPVSFIGRYTLMLFVNPKVPARSVAELIEYARENPGKLNYATSVTGDVIAAAQFLNTAHVQMTRVPYKGAAQAIPDLLAGRVDVAFAPASAGLPHVKDGRLHALATFLPKRSPAARDVPTIAEAGMPGVSVNPWVGVFGPAKTPTKIVDRLSRELILILKQPEVQRHFDQQAFQAEGSTPDELAGYLKHDLDTWAVTIRESGIERD
jgi:putative tricarboxylic transport membrane protein